MKKWIFLLVAAVFLLCAGAASASAATPKTTETVPKLILDGKEVKAAVPPMLIDDWVLVPIRTVAEHLGYKVGWDQDRKQVTVRDGSTEILMTLGSKTALVNGREMSMNAAPVLLNDTTLIPLRFVSESLGVQILWDNKDKAVYLYTDAAGKPGADEPSGHGQDEGAEPENPAGSGQRPDSPAEKGGDNGDTGDAGKPASGGGNTGTEAPGGGAGRDEGQQQEEGPSGTPDPDPPAEPAKLSEIRYQPNVLVLTYTGTLTPVVHYLSGPERLVVDLVHAEFADEFSSGFSSGIVPDYRPVLTEAPAGGQIAEMKVSGDSHVTGIRFSKFSDNPRTVRVVLDLSALPPYELTNHEDLGVVTLRLKPEAPPVPAKDRYIVVLDAGHGGSDPGAKSLSGKWEKDFNLSVVKKVKEILSKESKIQLVLTREGDTYPTLDDRINLANSLNADLFISVHGNSNTKPDVNGTETYYWRPESQPLAELLHKNAVAATGFKDNGVRTAEFKVVKYTTMPAALLEVGYLSNADNEKKMLDEKFQQRVAEAIAATIKQYFKLS